MATIPSPKTSSREELRFYLLAGMVFFAMMGGLMFLFAATFIRDMQTLRGMPDALWNFLCGTPTDNQIALPLLLTIGIVATGISITLQIFRVRLRSRGSHD